MRVSELFIQLGISGQNDVTKGLKTISSSMKELFSMSIQTKLTLAGLIGGFTAAAMSAGKTGASLMSLKGAYDFDLKKLQNVLYFFNQFEVGSDEATNAITSLQEAWRGALEGREEINKIFTHLGVGDLTKYKDVFELLGEIQKRAKDNSMSLDWRRYASQLLGNPAFSAIIRGPDIGAFKAPAGFVRSEAQLRAQEQINRDFKNFNEKMKNSLDSFVVKNKDVLEFFLKKIDILLTDLLTFLKDHSDDFKRIAIGLGEMAKSISDFLNLFPKKSDKDNLPNEEARFKNIQNHPETAFGGKLNPLVYGGKFADWFFSNILGFEDQVKPVQRPSDKFRFFDKSTSDSQGITVNINGFEITDNLKQDTKMDFSNVIRQIPRGNR